MNEQVLRLPACAAVIIAVLLLTACSLEAPERKQPYTSSTVPCDQRLKQAINRTPGPYGPDVINDLIVQVQFENQDCTAFTWDPIPREAKDSMSCSYTQLQTPGAVGGLPIPHDLARTRQDPQTVSASTHPRRTHWLTPNSTVSRSGNVVIHWNTIALPHDQANCWIYDASLKTWAGE